MQTRRLRTALRHRDRVQNGRRPVRISYPESDGKPMAESPIHVEALMRSLLLVQDFHAGDPLVYIGADMFLYYEEGNVAACVAPDLFVVKGVAKLPLRDSYKLWLEKLPPCFVLELTSPSTAAEDRRKLAIYARLGVVECFLHNPRPPTARRRAPSLQGYRLGAGGYEPIPEEPGGGVVSRELGLRLVVEDGRLEWYNQATGERLLDPRERAAVEAEMRREAEARARTAEQRLAELEALLREQHPPRS